MLVMMKDYAKARRDKIRGFQEEIEGDCSDENNNSEGGVEDHMKNEDFSPGDFVHNRFTKSPQTKQRNGAYGRSMDDLSKHIAVKIQEDTPLLTPRQSESTAEVMQPFI